MQEKLYCQCTTNSCATLVLHLNINPFFDDRNHFLKWLRCKMHFNSKIGMRVCSLNRYVRPSHSRCSTQMSNKQIHFPTKFIVVWCGNQKVEIKNIFFAFANIYMSLWADHVHFVQPDDCCCNLSWEFPIWLCL